MADPPAAAHPDRPDRHAEEEPTLDPDAPGRGLDETEEAIPEPNEPA